MSKKRATGLIVFFGIVAAGMLLFCLWFNGDADDSDSGTLETDQKYAEQICELEKRAESEAVNIVDRIKETRGFTDNDVKTVSEAMDELCMDSDNKKKVSFDDEIQRLYNISLIFYISDVILNKGSSSDADMKLKNTEVCRIASEAHTFMTDRMIDADEQISNGRAEEIVSDIESGMKKLADDLAVNKQEELSKYMESVENAVL